jgi:hypothetical protein
VVLAGKRKHEGVQGNGTNNCKQKPISSKGARKVYRKNKRRLAALFMLSSTANIEG